MRNESRITKAFRKLRELGYFAKQNFWCCQSCGWAAIPDDKVDKAVFYHNQDREGLRKTGETHLAWSGNGEEIAQVCRDAGLIVKWNGDENTRIHVTDTDYNIV